MLVSCKYLERYFIYLILCSHLEYLWKTMNIYCSNTSDVDGNPISSNVLIFIKSVIHIVEHVGITGMVSLE